MDKKVGNILLGEFVGYQEANFGIYKEELEFDTDWNDLFHVIDKCKKTLAPLEYHKAIEDALINGDSENRKKNVWTACVKFVQYTIKNT